MNRIEFGNNVATMRRWAAEGVRVQTCITSPPYFGLRSYLPADHPDKSQEIGTEETPEQFIAGLVEVFRAVRDVLADDGTLWINIGDSYATRWSSERNKGRAGLADNARERHGKPPDGFKNKDLIGVPWMLAFALRADGWYLRQDIVWSKPNPMPESVRDRCTKSHEYVFLLTKSERYFYDSEAVKEAAAPSSIARWAQNVDSQRGSDRVPGKTNGTMKAVGGPRSRRDSFKRDDSKRAQVLPGQAVGTHRPDRAESEWPLETRNRRSVWTVPTRPYKGAHFAVFPEALVDPCVLAATSERGHCPKCGARWARQTRPEIELAHTGNTGSAYPEGSTANRLAMLRQAAREQGREYTGARITTGWAPTCACGAEPVPDIVLDPFIGSGTTAAVAVRHGRQYLGCELNEDYAALQRERIEAASRPAAKARKPRAKAGAAPARTGATTGQLRQVNRSPASEAAARAQEADHQFEMFGEQA